jgi:hypothetical protein
MTDLNNKLQSLAERCSDITKCNEYKYHSLPPCSEWSIVSELPECIIHEVLEASYKLLDLIQII